jgi:hypothetical protein
MTKLTQICASENDLFGLDGEGVVYQYNFKTNSWTKLGEGRTDGGDSPGTDRQTRMTQSRSRTAPPPARG